MCAAIFLAPPNKGFVRLEPGLWEMANYLTVCTLTYLAIIYPSHIICSINTIILGV